MDWQNPSEEQRVVLGVMKRPAKTKENLMPPLFINPGVSGSSKSVRRDADFRKGARRLRYQSTSDHRRTYSDHCR